MSTTNLQHQWPILHLKLGPNSIASQPHKSGPLPQGPSELNRIFHNTSISISLSLSLSSEICILCYISLSVLSFRFFCSLIL
ncbi:hypothetical protein VNO77_00024 [Canavalia gladiata]|uniref:Uncharacterized protein n=1 Tax=Canavalia gladiata TaxID=3824 RepID=A0AAN9MV14_CANGL